MQIIYEDIVLIGSFNIGLFNPNWMKEKNIYDGEVIPEFDLASGNFRYLLKKLQLYLGVVSNRITIQNINNLERFNSNKFNFLVQLFKILPHTPIAAIGYNLHVNLSDSKRETIKTLMQENCKKLNIEENIAQSQFSYKIRREYDILINYQLDNINGDRAIFNFEDRLIEKSNNKDKSIKKFIDKIEEFNKYAISHI